MNLALFEFTAFQPQRAFPVPQTADETSPRPGTKEVTVLVVDDEGLIADSVAEILNDSGYKATPVYSGQAAIEFAERESPQIVMTDVLMPKMNGVETALAIQKVCPAARILLFSGQAATLDLLHQARAAGVEFEALPKPIHPEHLLKKINQLIAN